MSQSTNLIVTLVVVAALLIFTAVNVNNSFLDESEVIEKAETKINHLQSSAVNQSTYHQKDKPAHPLLSKVDDQTQQHVPQTIFTSILEEDNVDTKVSTAPDTEPDNNGHQDETTPDDCPETPEELVIAKSAKLVQQQTDHEKRYVVVTGAAGFIGSHVAKHCSELGFNVLVVDDLSGGFMSNVDLTNDKITFLKGSITNETFIDNMFKKYGDKIDYIYHLAAYAAEGLSHFIRIFNYENNLVGSTRLLNYAVNYKIKCMIFTSSIAIYGSGPYEGFRGKFTEKMHGNPEDPYGIGKYSFEYDLEAAHSMFGLKYIVFRPHNVYGPNQNIYDKYRNVIGIFLYNLLNNQSMNIFGNGGQKRSFSYIDDVAPYISLSPLHDSLYNRKYNIGNEQAYTLNELAQYIIRICLFENKLFQKLNQFNRYVIFNEFEKIVEGKSDDDISSSQDEIVDKLFQNEKIVKHIEMRNEVFLAEASHKYFNCKFGIDIKKLTHLYNGLNSTLNWIIGTNYDLSNGALLSNFRPITFKSVEIADNLPNSWANDAKKHSKDGTVAISTRAEIHHDVDSDTHDNTNNNDDGNTEEKTDKVPSSPSDQTTKHRPVPQTQTDDQTDTATDSSNVNVVMLPHDRVHGIYMKGFTYQLRKHIYDYGCTPQCKDGSNISVSMDRILPASAASQFIDTMDDNSNYWIHYQTEQCFIGTHKDKDQTFWRANTFENTIDLLIDWSPHQASNKDKCYPHVKRATSLNFDATIDPKYLNNSIEYFQDMKKDGLTVETYDDKRNIDVLLFGTMKDPRSIRKLFCKNMKEKYPTLTVDCKQAWGDELVSKLKRSKLCINLHFYELASLETHKINQCLLWNVPVISERSGDVELDKKYEELYGVIFVDFVDIKDDNEKALEMFLEQAKQLLDDKQKRFQSSQMAHKNLVKLNHHKNEQICQLAQSIKCHYPK